VVVYYTDTIAKFSRYTCKFKFKFCLWSSCILDSIRRLRFWDEKCLQCWWEITLRLF